MHAANTVLLLVELGVNRLLLATRSLSYLILWSLLYAAFAWAQNALTDFWPYFFLKLDTWWALAWYFTVVALHLVVFALVALLERLKVWARPQLATEASTSANDGGVEPLSSAAVSLID